MAYTRSGAVEADINLGRGSVNVENAITKVLEAQQKVGIHSFFSSNVYNVLDGDGTTAGATGDGVADDSAALQACVDTLAGNRGIIIFPPGTYRITSSLTNTNWYQTWVFLGQSWIYADFDGVAVKIGQDSAFTRHFNWLGGGVVRNTDLTTVDWDAGNVGIELDNVVYSTLNPQLIFGFEKGLHLYSTGTGFGTSYNRFGPEHIVDNKYGIYMWSTSDGFVNDNWFYGGRVGYAQTTTIATGAYAVYMDADQVSAPVGKDLNGNDFHSFTLELAAGHSNPPAGALYLGGWGNFFSGMRWEGFASPFINGRAAAWNLGGNVFIGGTTLKDESDITSGLNSHIMIARNNRFFGGGSSTGALLTLRENNLNTNKALRVLTTGGVERFTVLSDGEVKVSTGGGIVIGDTGTKIIHHKSVTATWDPASIANGASASTTVTVTGAAVGETVFANFSKAVAGWIVHAEVTSADTVTVTLANFTGGAVDLGSGTVRVTWTDH